MPLRIEDYAVIGNCETVALVGRDGSIDWLCLPRFDSAACFSALLGGPENGRWLIAPAQNGVQTTRRYLDNTLILETVFTTAHGSVSLIDFMYRRDGSSELVRIVRGLQGEVSMRTEITVRFDYGAVVPWVSQQQDGRLQFIAGPDRLLLDTAVPTRGEDFRTVGEFVVREGENVSFVLNWSPSFRAAPPPLLEAELVGGDQAGQLVLDWLGGCFQAARALGRRRSSLAPDFEIARPLGNWRHRRGGDNLLARTVGRPAQLGLSILLASRRDLHTLCADRGRLPRRGEGLARVAFARGRWGAGRPADRLRCGGRTAAPGIRNSMAAWLRRLGSGPKSATAPWTAPTRCLWRSARRLLRRAPRRSLDERRDLVAGMRAPFASRNNLARA